KHSRRIIPLHWWIAGVNFSGFVMKMNWHGKISTRLSADRIYAPFRGFTPLMDFFPPFWNRSIEPFTAENAEDTEENFLESRGEIPLCLCAAVVKRVTSLRN